jgi:hypothetical protein
LALSKSHKKTFPSLSGRCIVFFELAAHAASSTFWPHGAIP